MQNSWDAGLEGCRKGRTQDKYDEQESIGIQDKWDEGRGMQVKRDA